MKRLNCVLLSHIDLNHGQFTQEEKRAIASVLRYFNNIMNIKCWGKVGNSDVVQHLRLLFLMAKLRCVGARWLRFDARKDNHSINSFI